MINRIKKFFSKESKDENLLAVSVKDWSLEYKKLLEKHSGDLQSAVIQKINLRCVDLKESADKLLKAQLKNDSINNRLSDMIDDTRINYVSAVKMLADNAAIKTGGVMDVALVCSSFMNKLNSFSGTSNKAYFSLKDIFYAEVSTISENIKSLNSFYKELEEATKKGVGKEFEELKALTRSYYSDLALEKNLNQEIATCSLEIEDAKKQLFEINKRKDAIKLSNWFKQIKEPYEARENVESDLNKLNEEISGTIMNLADVLKQLNTNKDNKKLIEKYIKDPVSSLLWDESLEILAVLEELKNALKDKVIDVDAKTRQKLAGSIEKMQKKEFFAQWINEHKKLHQSKRALDDTIGKNSIMSDLFEVDYQITHMQEKIGKRRKTIALNEEKMKELNLLTRKEDIESALTKFAGKRILLT